MCTPQAGRVFNGIATAGLSEAVRPMLGRGNQDFLDNYGQFNTGVGIPNLIQRTTKEEQQQQAPQTDYSKYFQPIYQNQTIK